MTPISLVKINIPSIKSTIISAVAEALRVEYIEI
jgi:hypothetical protein